MAGNPLIQLTPLGVVFAFFGSVALLDSVTNVTFGTLGAISWIVVIGAALGLLVKIHG